MPTETRPGPNYIAELSRYIKPDRLEAVLDRPAEALGGLTARQMIAAGRGDELLDVYRRTLSYQVPL